MAIRTSTAGAKTVIAASVAYMGEDGQWLVPENALVENQLVAADLPSADPHVKGQIWNNAGVFTVSQG